MIGYSCKIIGGKIVEKISHSSDVSMSEISDLVFLLHKQVNELCELDSEKTFILKYPIDKDGNLIKEEEE